RHKTQASRQFRIIRSITQALRPQELQASKNTH
ncbi:hypothetical protein CCACVL1_05353, partial [Corchorus capsularis]